MDEHESTTPKIGSDPLWDAFVDPPDESRPRAWWHWMDGNVDPVGIERDLRWMHAAGLRGAQVFDGGMGGPLVVPSPVRPGTPDWERAVDVAVETAASLGMELAVATSSGWSASGGPWVRPADAMKKLVWSECDITGGRRVEVGLPPLPDVPGPFQDCPRWGADGSAGGGFAVDWRVLAFPADASRTILAPASVHASAVVDDVACLTDGGFGRALALPRDPDHRSTAWIEQEFDAATTVRSVTVGLPGPRGFGAAPPADAVLQVSDDGVEYRDVAVLPPSTVPVRTVSFPAVTARRFRLVLSAASAAEALPPVAPGVRLPPVLRKADAFHVSEFALRTAGRVHFAEAKAGFGVVPDYHAVPTASTAAGAIDPASVIDVTEHVRDGVLRWTPPPGAWTVLRLGASITGQTNGPAPSDATGLEVDKLDGRRVRDYLATHLARFGVDGDAAASGTPRFPALLSDSIEAGSQNWTDAIVDHVRRRRGYDPTRWLPALTGLVVGSPDASDRFLYDYRRTIAELYADEYYGTLAAEAHRRGMTYYAEALEDGRPQLGDDLAMRAAADVPMGAMWTFDPSEGPSPTYVADLKGAASVAHVHGRHWVGAEAFTSFDRPWSWTPRTLKHVADLQLALGVTRFCIHTSPHQPIAAAPPGIALAPFLGQAFTVHETWSGMARPWIDYLARCSALLSMGAPAVDVAVFAGEEAPVTGLFEHRLDDAVPAGFDFDYVGPDALRDVFRVEGGRIVSDGAAYGALYLGGSSDRMTLPTLLAIERLLDAGAVVVGERPIGTPSLADDLAEFHAACERIWAARRDRGRVLGTSDLAGALQELGVRAALEIDGPPVRRIARDVDGRRVTFLANPSDEPIELRLRTAEPASLVAWDPVEVRRVPVERAADDAAVLALAPFGSVFVIASLAPADSDAPSAAATTVTLKGEWSLRLPGFPAASVSPDPRLWADVVVGAQGFSGVGTYRLEFAVDELPGGGDRVVLDLGTVREIAQARVNGVDCGVAWTEPFRLDVTTALRAGRNTLEVDVATPWRNRLIAEAGAPSGEIPTPMTTVFEPTAEPLPAGLAGPVTLVVEPRA